MTTIDNNNIELVRLSVLYRDADNYKSHFDIICTADQVENKKAGDEIALSDLGLSFEDIPLIQEFGFDPNSDHNLLDIEEITFIERGQNEL